MNGMGHVEKLLNYFAPEKLIAGTALVATVLNGQAMSISSVRAVPEQ